MQIWIKGISSYCYSPDFYLHIKLKKCKRERRLEINDGKQHYSKTYR